MKQLSADIGIIAAGPAGLAAAVAAAETGAKIVVFEKSSVTGGCGNMAMGPFAVESRLQKKQIVGLTRDEAFKMHMEFNHWIPDASLVRAFIDKSGDTIDWLEGMGVKFVLAARHFTTSQPTWHVLATGAGAHGTAAEIFKVLTMKAKELGVKFYFQTPAQKILKEGGNIVGFQAEERSGEMVQVNTRAVIVATGGFGGDTKWIKKYTGYEWGSDLFSFKIPGLEGDGIKMAWEVGAAKTHMMLELYCSVPNQAEFWNIDALFRQPNLLVNLNGERFFNEEVMQNNTFAGNAVSRQKNRCAFMIFDENIKNHYAKNGFDQICYDVPVNDACGFDAEMQRAVDSESKDFFMADTLEALGEKAGIHLPSFMETVADYNRACESRDALFNKNYKFMKPISAPRFYAGRLVPSGFGSLGGIRINYKCEVIDKSFNVIPGLYAAGTDANAIHSDSYTFIMPGNSMGFAINSGRIAGEHAAEYLASL
ncbi:MAG: FAD-dependent oxidoreductase [Deltaproteobacteria bacterium]|nr:FAD-dependent oxidoreductase [Deltaproteobacteria bacterium]